MRIWAPSWILLFLQTEGFLEFLSAPFPAGLPQAVPTPSSRCSLPKFPRVSLSLMSLFHFSLSLVHLLQFWWGFRKEVKCLVNVIWASQVALVVKNLPTKSGNVRDTGSIPGWGRSPGEGQGNPLSSSCLENSMGKGAWKATVHGVAKSQTRLK